MQQSDYGTLYAQNAAQGQAGAPTVELESLSGINGQTTENLVHAISMAHAINLRISGPRPEAIEANGDKGPSTDYAMYTARQHRDASYVLVNLLSRVVQSL